MKIIHVKHEKECPSPHMTFLDETPEGAAITVKKRVGQEVDTVYWLGRRVFVPITVTPDQFWASMDNKV
jgi:hypothetical protein